MLFGLFFSLRAAYTKDRNITLSWGGRSCQTSRNHSGILDFKYFPRDRALGLTKSEAEVVPEGNFAMWWLRNCGVWIKTQVELMWSWIFGLTAGKSTKRSKGMVRGHQMAKYGRRLRKLQPNLRVQPAMVL